MSAEQSDTAENPICPACGTEMITDGVDTADGLEECHRCPRCRLVIVVPGLWSQIHLRDDR
ncbi:zf-TFIIB domain-containing protein [Cryobacterium luteum]|uniref:Uncharacterized protein n=1 Tax=Cryobacterium luteum TaxID=1424661 RepID=A0A1H8FKD0_9MICO|nr:zf-TFIIB domain-containing protein [Cryobacterium luteum]TFB93388.1 hypothetical protein E3O10_03725 [Cryobacterium luteum]SEN32086.1 hypothetical protein SAMN05216281_10663 [Cryobacterium luteum]